MELHFQPPPQQQSPLPVAKTTKFKGRARGSGGGKFVGVRQRPSGRWVAEIKDTTQKIRMWLGTFETAEAAARAYDEAACLLRGSNTRTNFLTHPSPDSPLATRIRSQLSQKRLRRASAVAAAAAATSASSTDSGSCTEELELVSDPSPTADRDEKKQASLLFDDNEVYQPYFSNGYEELELVSDPSWAFDSLPLFDSSSSGGSFFEDSGTAGGSGVERQISASLYAMNGVQEYYLDSVHDASDPLWDLPPLYHHLCRS